MHSGRKGIELFEYEPNSEWDIVSTNWKEEFTSVEASITFELKIKRKPLYVILAVILPIAMLALLNICVFVLPCDSGEKASYAITVFLAFAVFMTIISSTLPENSENVAIFSIFLIIQTICSTLITMTALVMVRLSSRPDTEPVPRWLTSLLRRLTCQCFCKKKKSNKVQDVSSTDGKDWVEEDTSSEATEVDQLTWKQAMTLLDRVFFVFFFMLFFLSSLLSFTIASIISSSHS